MDDHDIAYKSSVYFFVHRKFCLQRKKIATDEITERSGSQRCLKLWRAIEETTTHNDREEIEGKEYEEKKRTSDSGGRRDGNCRMEQQNHLTQREREMAKPTARIRGNRRVGAGFRLSVAIATSAALWLGERAADGKSLVRTIIPRVAILQSGPSRSVVLHSRLHTSRCFRLSLPHVAVASCAEESLVVLPIFTLYDVTIL